MVRTLTNRPTEAALQAAVKADHQERDRKAWNLPRASVQAAPQVRYRDGLEWDSFRDLYYPETHRHDFEAIVAYGAYRRTPRPHAGSDAVLLNDVVPADADSLGAWEDEGGPSRDPSLGGRER